MHAAIPRILSSFQVEIDRSRADQVAFFFDWLLEWNQKMNLSGAKRIEDLIGIHLPDGAAAAQAVMQHAIRNIADIGSGNGIPGVIIALLVPRVHVMLVEPRLKRAFFLRQTVHRLRLRNVEVLECRAESLEPLSQESAISRAVFRRQEWFRIARAIVQPGGWVFGFSSGKETPGPSDGALQPFFSRAYAVGEPPRRRRLDLYRRLPGTQTGATP